MKEYEAILYSVAHHDGADPSVMRQNYRSRRQASRRHEHQTALGV